MVNESEVNEFLAEYARTQSEHAFCQIVERCGGLVFRECLAEDGESQLAEEVTQSVFTLLAAKVGKPFRASFDYELALLGDEIRIS